MVCTSALSFGVFLRKDFRYIRRIHDLSLLLVLLLVLVLLSLCVCVCTCVHAHARVLQLYTVSQNVKDQFYNVCVMV